MLVKFTIASVDEKVRDAEWIDPIGGGKGTSKEYQYTIVGTDGNRYYIFHDSKPRLGLHKGKTVYGNSSRKMESDGLTKYGEYEGGYRLQFTRHPVLIDALDTPQKFAVAKKAEIERLEKLVESNLAEIKRLLEL